MSAVYLETSSLLRVLFRQPPFEKTAELLEQVDLVITTSIITIMETHRVVARAQAERLITEGAAQVILGTLAQHEDSWQAIELTDEIQQRVGRPFPVEPVRTLDAVHLASALELKKIYPELQICSDDEKIKVNLNPLGLDLWIPA